LFFSYQFALDQELMEKYLDLYETPETIFPKLPGSIKDDNLSLFKNLLAEYNLSVDTDSYKFRNATSCGNPLKCAVYWQANSIAEWLLNEGASVEEEAGEDSPLNIAGQKANHGIIPLLLKAGADIEHEGAGGMTPLAGTALAYSSSFDNPDFSRDGARERYFKTFQILLKNGANPDAETEKGNTALILAARANDDELARLLLDAGANSDLEDREGSTAVLIAERLNNLKVLTVLRPASSSSKSGWPVLDGPPEKALAEAIIAGRTAEARHLIEDEFPNIDFFYRDRPLIQWAVVKNDLATLTLLINNRAELDAVSDSEIKMDASKTPLKSWESHKATALALAAMSGNLKATQILLEGGAEVDSRPGSSARTPLLWAACPADSDEMIPVAITEKLHPFERDYSAVVKALINAGADYDIVWEGKVLLKEEKTDKPDRAKIFYRGSTTPLMCAASRREYAIVKLLVDAGANPLFEDSKGRRPLDDVIVESYVDGRINLPESDKDQANLQSNLQQAVSSGNAFRVRELLALGAYPEDISDRMGNSSTILDAASLGHAAVVKALIKAGAKAKFYSTGGDFTGVVEAAAKNNQVNVVRLIFDGGAWDQDTSNLAMRIALENRSNDVIRYLVQTGCLTDAEIENFIERAKQDGNPEAVELLRDHKTIRADYLAMTKLFIKAASDGNTSEIKKFAQQGGDIDSRNEAGETALIWAAHFGKSEAVKLLLDFGADPFLRTKDGRNALAAAQAEGRAEIVELFKDMEKQ